MALAWGFAAGLRLALRLLAWRSGRRARALGPQPMVLEAPVPLWRPVEALLLDAAGLVAGILTAAVLLPGSVPPQVVEPAAGVWAVAAACAAAGLGLEELSRAN